MSGAAQAFGPRGRNPYIGELAASVVRHLQRFQQLQEQAYPVPESATVATMQAVRFEVQRFEFSSLNRIIVEESVSEVFTERLSVFAFKPDPSWDVDPILHSDYTVCLVLAIPVSLRSIHKRIGLTGSIGARDAVGWISEVKDTICPYICPASAHG